VTIRKPKPGDVLEVALPDSTYAYGRVLIETVAFYRTRTRQSDEPPLGSRDYEFVVGVADDALTTWRTVGRDPVGAGDDGWAPPRHVEDPMRFGTFQIYHRGTLRQASTDEVRGLDPLTTYGADDVVTRLMTGRRPPTATESIRLIIERKEAEAREDRFWGMIESAWTPLGSDVNDVRHHLAAGTRGSDDVSLVDRSMDALLANLAAQSVDLSAKDLAGLDLILERKLYDLDRADLHAVVGGSDDGFLYARGFVVAAGRAFYDAVLRDPRLAVRNTECEGMCYLFADLYQDRFGELPNPGSLISRESRSNHTGWSGL
jgi:hypothetical protein